MAKRKSESRSAVAVPVPSPGVPIARRSRSTTTTAMVDPADIPDGPDVLVDVPVVKVDKIDDRGR